MTVCGDLPWIKLSARTPTLGNDVDDAGLRNYIEKRYTIAKVSKIVDGVLFAMLKCSRHPVREYLEGLTRTERPVQTRSSLTTLAPKILSTRERSPARL